MEATLAPCVVAVEGAEIPLAMRKLKGILDELTKAEIYHAPLRSNLKGMNADVAVERLISQEFENNWIWFSNVVVRAPCTKQGNSNQRGLVDSASHAL